jgi:2-dehydropantoate 2-reductase
MKICVFGAGAIGGLMAARLAQVDCDVSVVARGAQLKAIQDNGLTLRVGQTQQTSRVRASSDAAELGAQDYVIVAVKACGLTQALPALAPLLGPHTTVVPAMNGVPWWFFSGFGGPLEGMRLEGVDPGGAIATAIPGQSVLGCVVYPSAFVAEPGVIQHTGRWDLHLGEPNGHTSPRLQILSDLLNSAGFTCKITDQIRREIWIKLVGNAAFNPVSALTCATLDRMLAEPGIYELLKALMTEVTAVGKIMGLESQETPVGRIERGRPMGAIKFSMLQDMEHGRPLEFEALTGAVVNIGDRLGADIPTLRMVNGLIRQRALSM